MVRLTQTIQKGGCAAKVAAAALREILSEVSFPPRIAEVMVDGSTFDDAAIVRVSESLALVQTLDFFTPIVDTPYIFGQIAAANALSDVYAMGGLPKTAMAILAFPLVALGESVVRDVLQGACERLTAANASLVGGHSIDDETLKFGLSVTGFVPPEGYWTNSGARPGDLLILTKPLGTGTLAAGLKRSAYSEDDIRDALDAMVQLNDVPAHLTEKQVRSINAATDITGFGLAGHAYQMARESEVSLEIEFGNLPLFGLTLESLEKEHLTKAHRTNREYTEAAVDFGRLSAIQQQVVFDPQTSGGLLLSVPVDDAPQILESVSKRFRSARLIGKAVERRSRYLYFS